MIPAASMAARFLHLLSEEHMDPEAVSNRLSLSVYDNDLVRSRPHASRTRNRVAWVALQQSLSVQGPFATGSPNSADKSAANDKLFIVFLSIPRDSALMKTLSKLQTCSPPRSAAGPTRYLADHHPGQPQSNQVAHMARRKPSLGIQVSVRKPAASKA